MHLRAKCGLTAIVSSRQALSPSRKHRPQTLKVALNRSDPTERLSMTRAMPCPLPAESTRNDSADAENR